MRIDRRGFIAGLAAAGALAAPRAWAWPDRPMRIVMPFAPGGNGDLTIRIAAAGLADRLGQAMVVDNRPGAGGSIGTAEVARARADGYALLGATAGPLVINPLVQANISYQPLRDFAHIGLISRMPMVIILGNDVPARTLAELVALSKARPGRISIATSGIGGANHLPLELFNAATGAGLVHVPYRGGGAAIPDIMGGTVSGALTELSGVLDLHRAGRARIIAVAAPERSAMLPDAPTFIEAGFADFTAEAFVGISAPAGTPAAALARLQDALIATLADAGTQARLLALGGALATQAQQRPEGFIPYLEAEIAKARRGVEIAGLKPE
ncbi:MAG TPA: tripartite tricarboxylate transporter substrate binding protein [Roseomonas sp.]|jgi:tripartite-type tricarboxylate transporter receptor subunit TctC